MWRKSVKRLTDRLQIGSEHIQLLNPSKRSGKKGAKVPLNVREKHLKLAGRINFAHGRIQHSFRMSTSNADKHLVLHEIRRW